MKRAIPTFLLVLVLSSCLLASQVITDTLKRKVKIGSKHSLVELQKDIDAFLDAPEISNAFVGVSIMNIESGEFFYRKNDYKNFIPASTLKVLTTAAALNYLGADYCFQTRLYLNGYLSDTGEFNGDIIIRGGGDPTLSNSFFKDPIEVLNTFVKALDSIGIKSINGNIIGDDNYFDDENYAAGWAWDDFMYPFSAQVSALSVCDNKVDISIRPAKSQNQLADYVVLPNTKYVQIVNNVQTKSQNSISDVIVYREPYSNFIQLGGSIIKDSLDKEEVLTSVAIDNPTLFYLHLFKDCLDRQNIRVRGALVDIDDYRESITYADLHLVSTITSPPLKSIVKVMNKQSNNLIAELLLKTIAKEITGVGSFTKGCELLLKFASKVGITAERASIYDGSGLSRMNTVSPMNLVSILTYMFRSDNNDIFLKSLAVPGESGTLKRRLTKSVAQKQLWAKSGSMNGVNNLTGYILTKDKEYLAFAIMIMNNTVPQSISSNIIDLICMRLAAFSRKQDN